MEMALNESGPYRASTGNHEPSTSALERLTTYIEYGVNETIYGSEDPAHHWYRVLTGAARRLSVSTDGRRQIVDFVVPGNVFGFAAHDSYVLSTEAISPATTLARYPRSGLEALAQSDPQVSQWIGDEVFQSISRLELRTLILGRASAQARVSAFLLDWSIRRSGPQSCPIDLPMSRYDIADYLALAVETVSRVLTSLRTRHVIAFHSTRNLTICDREALELAASGRDDPPALAHPRWPKRPATVDAPHFMDSASYQP